jgi:hypothetical protein
MILKCRNCNHRIGYDIDNKQYRHVSTASDERDYDIVSDKCHYRQGGCFCERATIR